MALVALFKAWLFSCAGFLSKWTIAADKKTVPGETDTVVPGIIAERSPVQGKKQCQAASLRRYYPDQVLRVFLSEIAPPASAHPMAFGCEMQYLFIRHAF